MSDLYDIMNALKVAADDMIVEAGDYPVALAQVSEFDRNILTEDKYQSPLLMIIDTGEETTVADDGVDRRLERDILFRIFAKSDTDADLKKLMYDSTTTVKMWLDTNPAIHTKVLNLVYNNSQGLRFDPDQAAADVILGTTLMYWENHSTAVGTDVYGDPFLDSAVNKLYDKIVAYKDATTANDPKISYVYKQHGKAALSLNAATLGLVDGQGENRGHSDKGFTRWDMEFSVRVHTAFTGGAVDALATNRLINGLANYLKQSFDLIGGWQLTEVTGVTGPQAFDESGTIGAELTCVVTAHEEYTQI